MPWLWLFMRLMTMLIPIAMLLCGRRMQKAPGARNGSFGCRTGCSMRSESAWSFAQRLAGQTWTATGAALLPLAVWAMCLCLSRNAATIGIWGAAVTVAECVAMTVAAVPVERARKRNLDENGFPVQAGREA